MMLVISYFIQRNMLAGVLCKTIYHLHLAIPENKGTIDYYQCWYAMPLARQLPYNAKGRRETFPYYSAIIKMVPNCTLHVSESVAIESIQN